MLQPDIHRDVVRERHSDQLRLARTGELAARLGSARQEERRTFLARLRLRQRAGQAPSPAASA